MIRLAIAAPSAIFRAGLEALVASDPGVEFLGSFPDLASVHDVRPDVVLSAVGWEEIAPPSGGPVPALVVLSDEPQPSWSREALRSGVRAVLPRDASAEAVLAAVNAAASGLAVLDPHDLEPLLPAAGIRISDEADALTARELDVLRLMAEGAANKSIAWKLQISEHTVKFHVASILGKLRASSRTEAVATGIRKGLVLL